MGRSGDVSVSLRHSFLNEEFEKYSKALVKLVSVSIVDFTESQY